MRWEIFSNFSAQVRVMGQGSWYFSNNHQKKGRAYELWDLALSYQWESWTVSGWVKNVFDQTYAVRGFFFANDPPDFEDQLYRQRGEPRSWGVYGAYTF